MNALILTHALRVTLALSTTHVTVMHVLVQTTAKTKMVATRTRANRTHVQKKTHVQPIHAQEIHVILIHAQRTTVVGLITVKKMTVIVEYLISPASRFQTHLDKTYCQYVITFGSHF